MRTGTGLITIILHRGVRGGWGAWAHLEFKVRAKAFLQDNLQNFCRPDSSAPLIRCQEISLILISSVTKVDQAVWSKCSAAPVQMFHRPSHSILTRAPGGAMQGPLPCPSKVSPPPSVWPSSAALWCERPGARPTGSILHSVHNNEEHFEDPLLWRGVIMTRKRRVSPRLWLAAAQLHLQRSLLVLRFTKYSHCINRPPPTPRKKNLVFWSLRRLCST